MKIIKQRVFEGRNIYSHKKCIRIDVDLCGYCETPSKDIEGFNEGLLKMIPELYSHRCGIDEEGGFVKRLKEGTYLAHICEHMIIAIQNKIGVEVAYGKAREIDGDIYYIIFQYEYKTLGLESARLAIDIINSLINGESINYSCRIRLLSEIYSKEVIGPSTKAIKEAAERFGLPMFQLGESGFYQIGYGKKGRVIEATIGANTSCVGADISCDKLMTKELLKIQNIPVAEGCKVHNIINLLKEGEKVGYPLVLKPRFGSKGRGIILNITDEKELVNSYNELKDKYKELLLEKNIEGNDYRVCVVDDDVVAVSLRVPPFVTGNGKDTIRELIRKLNQSPYRGYDHEKPLTKIKINEDLLRVIGKNNYSLNSIPDKNEVVELRENANLSTGGVAIDCTDEICNENKELCIRAAKAIGLDICGIDIKSTDISIPLYESGVVVEVNTAPGIRMHEYPVKGKARDVGESIVKLQYNGIPCNIPVISVTGTNGKTTTTRLISHVLHNMGYIVGMTCTDGIYVDGKCIDKGDDTGFNSAKTILLNKDVEVAVLETARGGIIRKGLAYDLADAAVITNITEDHLGMDSVETMDDLAKVKSLVGEAVKEDGYVVINADDEYSKKIINRIPRRKIYFSRDKNNPLIKENMNNEGIAIYVDDNVLYAVNNKRKYKVIDLKYMPITLGCVLDFNIENAMAACGILVSLGIDYCMISKGFKTFKLNSECNSGRFNMYDVNGVNVILDYGHNLEGYKNIFNGINKIKKNKVIGVVGLPGDRSNESINKISQACADSLDMMIIKEDKDRRGRKKGEVPELMSKYIKQYNTDKKVTIELDECAALRKALASANVGDIIIVFYEKLEPLQQVIMNVNNENNFNIANTI